MTETFICYDPHIGIGEEPGECNMENGEKTETERRKYG